MNMKKSKFVFENKCKRDLNDRLNHDLLFLFFIFECKSNALCRPTLRTPNLVLV